MKLPSTLDFCWFEYDWQRPFVIDNVHELLSHIAAQTPRGYLVFEVRCVEGRISYLVGMSPQYKGKMIELFRGHGEIELHDVPTAFRKPVSSSQHLSISKPVLSLNAGVTDSVVRAGLAAMSATRKGEEAVVQVVLGRGFSPTTVPKKMSDPHESWLSKALFGVREATPDTMKSIKEKAGILGLHLGI